MPRLDLEGYERETRTLRQLLSIDDQLQPDMMTIIVKLKHFGLIRDYERVPDADFPDDEASWDPLTRVLKIRESTFCGANQLNPGSRQRFTIAHEIGHAWFQHKNLRHRNVSGRLVEKIAPTIRRDEREANAFAAAFLAPAHLVDDPFAISAEELAARFNLSISNARIRKEEVERMHRRKRGILRPLPHSIEEYLSRRKR